MHASDDASVIPAKAGIQLLALLCAAVNWIPAFAGMTVFCTVRQESNQERRL